MRARTTRVHRVHERLLLAVGVAALLVGCGGGDDDAPVADATSPGATDAAPTGDTDPASSGANTAVVTIGDERYEFDVTPSAIQRCDADFFGAFWALGAAPGSGGIEVLLPPEGDPNHDPARIIVRDDANDLEWQADVATELVTMGLPEGVSRVDEFTVDGSSVSGSASFVEANSVFAWVGQGSDPGSVPEPVEGTFQITCGD
jgi:hypothetical protein